MIITKYQMPYTVGRVTPNAPQTIEEIDSTLANKEIADEMNAALDLLYDQANALARMDADLLSPGLGGDLSAGRGQVSVADTTTVFGTEFPGKAILQYDTKGFGRRNTLDVVQNFEYRAPDGRTTTFRKSEVSEDFYFSNSSFDARLSKDTAFITHLS